MKYAAISLFGLMAVSVSASAVCIIEPLQKDLESATTIFVATVTDAKTAPSLGNMGDGDRYNVSYGFIVAKNIKGTPSDVSALITGAIYDDPKDDRFTILSEQSRLVPGDSILVVTDKPGDVQVSVIGCTPSRPWDDETYSVVSKLPGFTP